LNREEKVKASDNLSSIAEEPTLFQEKNKKKINLDSNAIINKLEPVNIMEYYLQRVETDETPSEAEQGMNNKRTDNIVRLMRENRPVYNKLDVLVKFLVKALVDNTQLEKVKQ
jgi:ribosome assembly protein YihI (activator of Der GTPase)